MFYKFKNFSRVLCFIFLFNLVVLNFGIKPKEVKASIIDINSVRVIDYELKVNNNYLVFDFSSYLSGDEKIEEFTLKKGDTVIAADAVNDSKKSWKSRFIPINGDKFTIQAVANLGGQKRKLSYAFNYNDYDTKYKITPTFNGDNFEVGLDTNWINLFNENDSVSFTFFNTTDGVESNKQSTTIKELKAASNKMIFKGKASSLSQNNIGYFLEAQIKGRTYRWKLFVTTINNKKEFKVIQMELKSASFTDAGKVNTELLLKDVTLQSGATMTRVNASSAEQNSTIDISKKIVNFTNQSLSMNTDYTYRLANNNIQHEGKVGFVMLNKFEDLNLKANVPNIQTSSVNLDLTSMASFLSKTDSKNKIYIYELNDNFSKGTKMGEKVSGLTSGINTLSLGNKNFSKDKSYLVELTNGENTITTSFVYTPINLTTSNVKYTSSSIAWEYPSGYTPSSGDKIEIFLRDKSRNGQYSSIPNTSLVHGNENINLSNKKSVDLTGLAPGTNYEAKVILNNQRGSVISYTEFTTQEFRLKDFIKIKDSYYDTTYYKIAWPRSRTITVEWDFEPSDMTFSKGDKVEIWVKPNSGGFTGYPTNEIYKNPYFVATENLNSLKSATITLPSWINKFHVDLIYTIGGKQILTPKPSGTDGETHYNRRTTAAKVTRPNFWITDQTQTTAKIEWEYDRDFEGNDTPGQYQTYQPENGHILKLHLKKINSLRDGTKTGFTADRETAEFYYVHGENGLNLLEQKEFTITGLEPGQMYRARLQHILQFPGDFDGNYRSTEDYFNFKTGAFTIDNLKAEQIGETPKVNVTWETTGAVDFVNGDNIKLYIKENTTSEYPETPAFTIEDMTKKEATIELPKYNTTYNVKVAYEIKGKEISEYVLAEVLGDIDVSVTDIKNSEASRNTDWSAKISWTYPNAYTESARKKDKIKLTVKKSTEPKEKTTSSLPNGEELEVTTKEKIITGLEANETYDVKVEFINDGAKVYTVDTSFKATNDLQVVGLVATDVKSKTATLKWGYTPSDKSFKDNDKVEIFIKQNQNQKSSDDLSNYKKIYTLTHKTTQTVNDELQVVSTEDTHSQHVGVNGDMSKFKSLNLIDLGVNKDYSIKVKYTLQKDTTTTEAEDGATEAQENGVEAITESEQKNEVAEAEVQFKTIADSFKATVFVSNQTSATYGWEYPVGYEIQDGDKVEIFVKQVEEDAKSNLTNEYGDTPLLTLVHGDEYDLNEITRVDISGLTPEAKYKSKIQFTMGKGTDASVISQEIDISTKSFEIKSFEVDSYQEYDILVKWEIEPADMTFNEADTVEIFVKRATDTNYPNDPSYKLTTDGDNNITNTFSDYVLAETIGEEQNMKLVYTIGDREYTKELTFTNSIDPIKASVFSVDETRALIQIESPKNYEFVNGDRLLIYAKDEFAGDGEIENDNFLVFEGIQSDIQSIPDDMNLIELSYLLPEARYEVLVALDLLDGKSESAKLELTTGGLSVSDIKLEAIRYNNSVISWNYGENEIDFYKDEDYNYTDKLIVAHKESDGNPIPSDLNSIKQLKNVEYLGGDIKDVKDASIEVEDTSKDYDVVVCYDLGGLLYTKNFKASYLSVSVDENSVVSNGAKLSWKYPSNITFGDGDKTEVFIRKKQDSNYPESPVSTSTGSSTTSYTLEGLEGSTEYIAKVQITKEGVQIEPVEVEFTTLATPSSEVVVEQIDYEITGMKAEFAIPNVENMSIDQSKPIGLRMGEEPYQGFTVRLSESGKSFVIEPTIPKKKYENIEVEIPLENGSVFKMTIKEFTTQPQDIAQDWISNAYWFAFERFPDEEGYNYWYEHRTLAKTLNGEYFLKNLMFAEDEFTNRNLQDRELIAALYQIVVNREYDEEGLNFWVGIYNENLQNASGNKKLAQEVLVDRMVHEPEFGRLCDKIGIFWRQSDQDAAGVVAP